MIVFGMSAVALVCISAVLVAVRLHECHLNVRRLFREIDNKKPANERPSSMPSTIVFTESLLALSRVRLLVRDDSPKPAPVESSLLA
jgi:hypothetical protein